MDSSLLFQSAQFILPLTIAVLGLCIYLFGFQSVKEPDYSYINNIAITRKKKQVKKNGIVQNGKPTTPVIKPKIETKTVVVGKENVQPVKKPKKAEVVDDAADLDQGDWLPAPIRGAANKKAAAAKQQISPKKSPTLAKKKSVLKEVNKEIPVASQEAKVEVPQKKKEAAKKRVQEEPAKIEEVEQEVTVVDFKKSGKKKGEVLMKVNEEVQLPDNSDLWEESKSRGNKKARARKD